MPTPPATTGAPPGTTAARLAALCSGPRRERRRWRRLAARDLLRCHFEWLGRPAPALGVIDISPRGVGLLLPVPVRPGEALRLLLTNAAGLCCVAAGWRVAHCRRAGQEFVAGGPFEPALAPDVYRLLLG